MNKRFPAIAFEICLFVALCFIPSCVVCPPCKETSTQVYFSPRGGATQAIINEIMNAQHEILVQAYSFTSTPIAKALVDANKRGVHVEVVLDKSQRKDSYTEATFLANMGVPTFIDSSHAIAHNKVMIIDKKIVITGSFNFTKAAEEKNAENVLIIMSKELASVYIDNWMRHKGHCEAYESRRWAMKGTDKKYYSMEFIEEDGKTYVLFYDANDNLVAKREIPHQDVTEAIRMNGKNS